MEFLKGKYISNYSKKKVLNLIRPFKPKIFKIKDSLIEQSIKEQINNLVI